MKDEIKEVDRSFYEFKKEDDYQYKIKKGLTKDIVLEISERKNDPEWWVLICLWLCESAEGMF